MWLFRFYVRLFARRGSTSIANLRSFSDLLLPDHRLPLFCVYRSGNEKPDDDDDDDEEAEDDDDDDEDGDDDAEADDDFIEDEDTDAAGSFVVPASQGFVCGSPTRTCARHAI